MNYLVLISQQTASYKQEHIKIRAGEPMVNFFLITIDRTPPRPTVHSQIFWAVSANIAGIQSH